MERMLVQQKEQQRELEELRKKLGQGCAKCEKEGEKSAGGEKGE